MRRYCASKSQCAMSVELTSSKMHDGCLGQTIGAFQQVFTIRWCVILRHWLTADDEAVMYKKLTDENQFD